MFTAEEADVIVFRLVVVAVQLGVLVLVPVARLLDAIDWARERVAEHRESW